MAPQMHRMYMREKALVKMLDHAQSAASSKREVLGFLLGNWAVWKDKRYIMVESAMTTDLVADHPEEWEREGLELSEIVARVEEASAGERLVGWYHAHPADAIRFSRNDVKLHLRLFPNGGGVGMVVDPVDMDMRAFVTRKSGMPLEVSYAII